MAFFVILLQIVPIFGSQCNKTSRKIENYFFKKNELYVKISKIILDNTEYDLLELGEKSLQCVYIVQKLQIIDLKKYNIIK